MGKPPLRKYFNPLWFMFLTAFVFCVSFIFLDYCSTVTDRRITILLLNTDDAKHSHLSKPSSFSFDFSETIDCPIKTSHYIDQNNGTDRSSNIPRCIDNAEFVTKVHTNNLDPCSGKYIYVYDLPSRFNEDLLKGCHSLSKWVDMCPYMSNLGLGPKVIEKSNEEVLLNGSWYATNQFSLEVIFHNTMKNYKCLTNDSSLASAIYVPYYAGLDVGQYLWGFNVSTRDASPKEVVKWLAQQPEWKRMLGRDHFIVGGRISSDFRRMTDTDEKHNWGTKLMFLPGLRNMSMLLIESVASYDNDFPIPYPTYFHPSKDMEIFQWQQRMRLVKRPYLFSFAGAPRPSSSSSTRSEIIKHCQSSRSCNFLGCFDGCCDDPVHVMKVFQSSVFCLQPPGDSFTRRSTFDSILAGCIPVFFDPRSAYDQYLWHFPENGSSYSVYIPESDFKEKRVMINETLSMVSESEVLAMREEVIKLIPRIIYRDPSSSLENIEDAFDIAVKGILGRIEALARNITNVKYSAADFVKLNNTNSFNVGDKGC